MTTYLCHIYSWQLFTINLFFIWNWNTQETVPQLLLYLKHQCVQTSSITFSETWAQCISALLHYIKDFLFRWQGSWRSDAPRAPFINTFTYLQVLPGVLIWSQLTESSMIYDCWVMFYARICIVDAISERTSLLLFAIIGVLLYLLFNVYY